MKKKRFIIIAVVYLAIVACFTIYWAGNFDKYVRYKGDEFAICLAFMIPLTYVLFLVAQLVARRAKVILLLFLPLAIAVVSIPFGFVVVAITGAGGTPGEVIYLFCSIYSVLTLLFIGILWMPAKGVR